VFGYNDGFFNPEIILGKDFYQLKVEETKEIVYL